MKGNWNFFVFFNGVWKFWRNIFVSFLVWLCERDNRYAIEMEWYLHLHFLCMSKCWVCQCVRFLEMDSIVPLAWSLSMTIRILFVRLNFVHQLLSQQVKTLVESKHTFPLFFFLFDKLYDKMFWKINFFFAALVKIEILRKITSVQKKITSKNSILSFSFNKFDIKFYRHDIFICDKNTKNSTW